MDFIPSIEFEIIHMSNVVITMVQLAPPFFTKRRDESTGKPIRYKNG